MFNFIGRLHPLIVHLPIGFLFLAILVEWAMGKSSSTANKRIVMFILVLGAVSAMVAIGCGWLLALDGEYESTILSWHRWLGTAIGILAILAPITKYFSKTKLYRLTLVLIGLLLMGTGHYGGSLTHGSDYLLQPLKGEAPMLIIKFWQVKTQIQLLSTILLFNPFLSANATIAITQKRIWRIGYDII